MSDTEQFQEGSRWSILHRSGGMNNQKQNQQENQDNKQPNRIWKLKMLQNISAKISIFTWIWTYIQAGPGRSRQSLSLNWGKPGCEGVQWAKEIDDEGRPWKWSTGIVSMLRINLKVSGGKKERKSGYKNRRRNIKTRRKKKKNRGNQEDKKK